MRIVIKSRFIILLIRIMRIAVESHFIIRGVDIGGRLNRVNAFYLMRNSDLEKGLYTRFNKGRERTLISRDR